MTILGVTKREEHKKIFENNGQKFSNFVENYRLIYFKRLTRQVQET